MHVMQEVDYLMHYGILRRSGRYPWGSGGPENNTGNRSFLDYVELLRKQGMSETEIARGMDTTTTQLRAAKSIAKNEQKQADILMARRLQERGHSNVAIGERMGINESSVRSLLAPAAADKAKVLDATSDMIREAVRSKKYIDVGVGAEHQLGVSQTKFKNAVAKLREEGYKLHYVKVQQLGTKFQTTLQVLTKEDVPYSEVSQNRDKITQITGKFTENGGRTWLGIKTPTPIKLSRVGINYAKDGGSDADGVIYVRPGVDDVSLGSSRYAQVRISVDGTHYLKGMAMYKDDLPEGKDLVFNTNKNDTGNKLDAMKELKDDPDNPFGSQIWRQSGVMNIVNEEGDWEEWSRNLSSQMLSKQSPKLAKTQLDMTFEQKKNDLDTIKALTNPAVRRKLLDSFAEDADSSAVHLKAAHLPRQGSHVILPVNSMKETEIYAPNFRPGEKVVLVRYPHGGTFEIPELTVNNRQAAAKKALGQAQDAVGIHPNVAKRLSGADFDGDTVLVIPNGRGDVKHTPALEKLKDFDPMMYKLPDDAPAVKGTTKQIEMGKVTNLITDMTIRKASQGELAQAIRHSMVVIDSEKHHLDYKASSIANGIPQLKEKYQGSRRAGASTLISRKKQSDFVPERKQGFKIDPETGRKIFTETGASFLDPKTGETVFRTEKAKKILEVKDVNELSSGTPIEKVYADHANKLKDLANQARLEQLNTRSHAYSPSAKAAYNDEVVTLRSKLNIALRNAPLERQAQLLANTTLAAKRQSNPDMDAAELKKVKSQALAEARTRTGAKKKLVDITTSEWQAIQAGAISNNMLEKILNNTDLDQIKKLATPKTLKLMTVTKTARAQQMLDAGYPQSEVADALGVSLSTLKLALK